MRGGRNFVGLLAAATVLAHSARAEWKVQKNEPDPFNSARSTFIASQYFSGGVVAVRCLEGGVSLVLIVGASNSAVAGEDVPLKMVADGKPIRDEEAKIISADQMSTVIQFGDEETLNYLKSVNKVSVRYDVGGAVVTESFAGGKPLTAIVLKALKACGLDEPPAPTVAPQAPAPAPLLVPTAAVPALAPTPSPATAPPGPLPVSTDNVLQFPPYAFTADDRKQLHTARLLEKMCATGGKVEQLIDNMVRTTTAFNKSDIPAARQIADGANAISPGTAKLMVKCP